MKIAQSGQAEGRHDEGRSVRVGDRVRVRRQRWLVTEVYPHGPCVLLTLSGLGAANLGVEQRVLTPFDVVESLAERRRFHIVRARGWRRACRELIADDGPAGILRTAREARMDLMPHQLEPALAIVRGLGSRVLIADEVGLGKTVQAALVVAELRARGAATRVLVLAPAGLREQWIEEFATRFNLTFTLFDSSSVVRHRATLPVGVNPWSITPLIITSVDYIKRPEVLPAVRSCRWDVVIVDEAHHAASDSDRHDAVAAISRLAPYVILLTATPHSGDSTAFASLCAIGQHDDSLLVFRRTRQEIGHRSERRVHQLRVRPSADERLMHASLAAFVRAVHREHGLRDRDIWLALATLRKRALSSAYALRRSVERRLRALCDDGESAFQLFLPLSDVAGELDAADAVPAWTIPALSDPAEERAMLMRIAEAAEIASRNETKLAVLERLLRRLSEPALVFTEYRDTLMHLRETIAPEAAVIHGGLSRDERRVSLARFARGGVLLATDAAGEGLNLHHSCRVVINLELPWNPMRLEQRIGRVDRIGQQSRVHAFHLIAAGTSEVRLLERLAARIARAQQDIGAPDPLGATDPESGNGVPDMPFHRLDTEAKAEHQRLTFARRIAGANTFVEADKRGRHATRPLVNFSKRRGVRSQLGSHVLVVLQSYASDETGRVVASHLTSVLVRAATEIRGSLRLLDTLGSAVTDDGRADWLEGTLAVHEAFWRTRRDREIAIARDTEGSEHEEVQPGLFDDRAEHEQLTKAEHLREARLESDRYISAAIRAAALTIHAACPALILLP